ncbi:hypothetical protein QQG55_55940 [Brugia pahangi]
MFMKIGLNGWTTLGMKNLSSFSAILKDNEYRHQIKQKTQLQICKHNEEQATFVFVNPLLKEVHVKHRDLVKEILQQVLIRHR